MARPQEKPVFQATTYYEGGEEYEEEAATATGCGFFRRFCCGWDKEESDNYLLKERGAPQKESWFADKARELKEFSELVAGPKWKNFIRKVGKLCNPKKYNKPATTTFMYSPDSYALNFAGGDRDQEDEGDLLHSFSMRYAPGSALIGEQQRRTGL